MSLSFVPLRSSSTSPSTPNLSGSLQSALFVVQTVLAKYVGEAGIPALTDDRVPNERLFSFLSKVVADVQEGHAFTDSPTVLLETLKAAPYVFQPLFGLQTVAPEKELFVLWQERMYLAKYWNCEARISIFLQSIKNNAGLKPVPNLEKLDALIDEVLPADINGFNASQRIAVDHAIRHSFTVISGGPGTGKTRTVQAILAALAQLSTHERIALLAPTGKAAARLSEMDIGSNSQQVLATGTVHRQIFSDDGLKDLTLVVVDEASMLDLVLADRLIRQVQRFGCRLILLGDPNQLEAVETGALFSSLCEETALNAGWHCHLNHTFRFDKDSAVAKAAKALEDRQPNDLLQALAPMEWRPDKERIHQVFQGYQQYISIVREYLNKAEAYSSELAQSLHKAFGRYRLMVAVNEGLSGQKQLSRTLDLMARHALEEVSILSESGARFFSGQPIMFTKNNRLMAVNNGDIGIIFNGKVLLNDGRSFSTAFAEDFISAWAITVHKAQGSEFDEVAFVMPGKPVSKALLYTALTRARKRFQLYGNTSDLAASAVLEAPRRTSIIGRHG